MKDSIFSLIRPIKEGDLIYLNEWKNNYEIFKYLGGGFQPVSIDEQKKWMSDMMCLSGSNQRFMIHPNESKEPIGMIGLYKINNINRIAELGIYIGNEQWHGKGFARLAYKEIENYAKNVLNLRKIKLFTVSKNTKAINLFNMNGFQLVGKLTQERYINGEYLDLLIMEKFLRGDFQDEE